MLTLSHIEEVLQKTLASIEQQRQQAAAAAEADKHQYAGALEGARFFGHLLAEKAKELEAAIISHVNAIIEEPANATAVQAADGHEGATQAAPGGAPDGQGVQANDTDTHTAG